MMTRRALTLLWTQRRLSSVETSSIVGAFVRNFAAAATSKGSVKKETKKAKKAENTSEKKPRRLSSYALFLKEFHTKQRNMGIPLPELSRQASKQWTEMSKDRQQKYVDEANRLNVIVDVEKPKVKDAATKRSANPYIVFFKSVWPTVTRQHPEKTAAERVRIVAEMWRNLSPEEKARRKEACLAVNAAAT